ncbi:ANTAR domain-containing protein [Nocardioides sp. SYSU D00065]|uniref:ANTAR domain-containing protein n=1 Tax=Nocardioides sp. SYSU D00065 TaxID=2817378 RepID=UPI001B328EB0|nr:ANTAR domain-containing protein [Nocardioides sp. SYSU D00065]
MSSRGSASSAESLRDQIAQLQEALPSQRDIGIAIGLISARFGCSTDQAWRLLLRVSHNSNTKVRTVARVLVATHDGSADAAELGLLDVLREHLPASGWPTRPETEEDAAP